MSLGLLLLLLMVFDVPVVISVPLMILLCSPMVSMAFVYGSVTGGQQCPQ